MKKILLLLFFFVSFISGIAKANEPYKGYRGYVDVAFGDAYNFNTAQTISTNNMQLYTMISTTHGYQLKDWFVGGGIGYYHSYRDRENMYPIYAAGRYSFKRVKCYPYIGVRTGILYDPYWVSKVQAYGALSTGMNVYKGLQVGMRASIFSRPSRYFTANAAIVLSYEIGN